MSDISSFKQSSEAVLWFVLDLLRVCLDGSMSRDQAQILQVQGKQENAIIEKTQI